MPYPFPHQVVKVFIEIARSILFFFWEILAHVIRAVVLGSGYRPVAGVTDDVDNFIHLTENLPTSFTNRRVGPNMVCFGQVIRKVQNRHLEYTADPISQL